METKGVEAWADPLAVRLLAMLAMVVPLGMVFVAMVQSALIAQAAVHLCRWPATISCARGVPLMWPVLSVAGWVLAGVATVDWLLFASRRRRDSANRLLAWMVWGPYVALCTVLAIDGRSIEMGDLVLGVTVVVSSLLIVARTITGWTGIAHRWALIGLSPLIAAAVLAPWWAPAAFTAAERAEQRARSPSQEFFELDDFHINPPDAALP